MGGRSSAVAGTGTADNAMAVGNNRTRAKVISAAPLEEPEIEKIKGTLTRMANQEVILELEVDEDILGGIIAHLGSQVYDGSIRNQLQQIRENLSKGR